MDPTAENHDGAIAANDAQASVRARDAVGVEIVVPIVVETVQVGKRTVDTGRGVRIHKRVHEDVVTFDDPLQYDEVSVERVPVGRTIEAHPPVRHEGDTTIFPIVAERIVTQVVLELVEEIRVTRTRSSRVVPQDVVVRREEATVERFDDADTRPVGSGPTAVG